MSIMTNYRFIIPLNANVYSCFTLGMKSHKSEEVGRLNKTYLILR